MNKSLNSSRVVQEFEIEINDTIYHRKLTFKRVKTFLKSHASKRICIGIMNKSLNSSSFEAKLAISLIREFEIEINDTIYQDIGLAESFKTTGELENVKWVQKGQNFYLTSQGVETNDLETNF